MSASDGRAAAAVVLCFQDTFRNRKLLHSHCSSEASAAASSEEEKSFNHENRNSPRVSVCLSALNVADNLQSQAPLF